MDKTIRTLAGVTLEQRLATAMHTAIHNLTKLAEEGSDSIRLQAASYLIELGLEEGIPIQEGVPLDDDPGEGSPPGGIGPIPVQRSHSMGVVRIKREANYE